MHGALAVEPENTVLESGERSAVADLRDVGGGAAQVSVELADGAVIIEDRAVEDLSARVVSRDNQAIRVVLRKLALLRKIGAIGIDRSVRVANRVANGRSFDLKAADFDGIVLAGVSNDAGNVGYAPDTSLRRTPARQT